MNLSNRAKIALVLGVLLVIAVILVFWFNRQNQKSANEPDQTPTASSDIDVPELTKLPGEEETEPAISPSPVSSDQINYISPTATASGKVTARTPVSTVDERGIRTYEITVTPAPGAGPLDWTRTTKSLIIKDASASQYANKTFCEMAGLSDSWSNMFEKITCDLLNYYDQKILEPLLNLTCDLTTSALQANVNMNVTYEFRDGACLIIDRK